MDVFKSWRSDLPASVVVFLVALPLCLGISLASGAPMSGGLIAGVIGGVVIGLLSGSSTSVSGPAAGLALIVLTAIQDIGSYEQFLVCVLLAGLLQIVFGLLKGGIIGNFVPNSVIKGMLTSIGIVLIFKQIPHALGFDKDYEGDESFFQADGQNTFTEILDSLFALSPAAVLVSLVGFAILLFGGKIPFLNKGILANVPLTLWAVIFCTLFSVFALPELGLALEPSHLVNLPDVSGGRFFIHPDFEGLTRMVVLVAAFKIAVVASLESLLSIEATDKLDERKQLTPTSRELVAQGVGNTLSGIIGGLPITAVIVRSSANITAGGKSKLSAVLHGIWLIVAIVFLGPLINHLPLSALAVILIMVGYKLTSPKLIKSVYHQGWDQFVPFATTIIAVLFSDLLIGVAVGMVVALGIIMRNNTRRTVRLTRDGNAYLIKMRNGVNFINRVYIRNIFERIPEGAYVMVDGIQATYIDQDIQELLDDFVLMAPTRNIKLEIKRSKNALTAYFKIAD